jgi:hypothetical protein
MLYCEKSVCLCALSVGASLTGLASVGMVDCDADAAICQRLRDLVKVSQGRVGDPD